MFFFFFRVKDDDFVRGVYVRWKEKKEVYLEIVKCYVFCFC